MILSLDLSSKTGYAIFEKDSNGVDYCLSHFGKSKQFDSPFTEIYPGGQNHPLELIKCVKSVVDYLLNIDLDVELLEWIVIEQTNRGMNRYSQKYLEWIHYEFNRTIIEDLNILSKPNFKGVVYLDSSEWRKIVGVKLDRDIKNHNKKLARAGEKGKISLKHLSVYRVNTVHNLDLKLSDNDIADAISLGDAFLEILKMGYDNYLQDKKDTRIEKVKKVKASRKSRSKKPTREIHTCDICESTKIEFLTKLMDDKTYNIIKTCKSCLSTKLVAEGFANLREARKYKRKLI